MSVYPRLAITGIIKNRKIYGPYLLTCIGMVLIYYILRFLMGSGRIAAMQGGETLQTMLSMGAAVFVVFIVIFLFYTNSFLIRNRKREFGLYNILGMGKRNLARILVWESLFMSAISLGGGLLGGILFSRLAELCMARILDGEVSMHFFLEPAPVKTTALLFICIFALILLNALLQVGRSKPIDLLNSQAAGEKPPRANWALAVLGVLILGGAYYIALAIKDPVSAFLMFFVAVGMVIAATYLLFIAGSVALCRILQRNRSYYYRANHFVSVSSMVYRMKRNGCGLASICVLATMVLVMVSSTTCMYVGTENRLVRQYPYQIWAYCHTSDETAGESGLQNDADIQQIKDTVDAALLDLGVEKLEELTYSYFAVSAFLQEDQAVMDSEKISAQMDYSDVRAVYFVSLEDYNRITGSSEELGEEEALLYSSVSGYESDTFTLEGCGTWNIKGQTEDFLQSGDAIVSLIDSMYLVVEDMDGTLKTVRTYLESRNEKLPSEVYYYGMNISGDEEAWTKEINSRFKTLVSEDGTFPSVSWDCRAEKRGDYYGLYGGLFVLGVLLGFVFLAATVLIMYYKQVTEGYEDQKKFDIMQRVGMTGKEIHSSIRSQMFTVFLAPPLLAGVHTAFAFPVVQKLLRLLGVTNTGLLIGTNVVCFLVFVLFYGAVYIATSRAYYRIVSGGREQAQNQRRP